MSISNYQIRFIFGEIIKGFSKSNDIYIKHFNQYDLGEIDYNYEIFYQECLSKGISSEKSRMEHLARSGEWTNENEREIKTISRMIENLEKTKRNLWLEKQIKDINDQLMREKANYAAKLARRNKVIGMTAEKAASNKTNDLYLFYALITDNEFKKPLFNRDDFDNLSEEEFNRYQDIYNDKLQYFSTKYIQMAALSSYAQNLYNLCEDRPYDFFGRPLYLLTVYQQELLRWMRDFSFIIKNSNEIPEELYQNPEKLVDWYVSGKKLKEKVEAGKDEKRSITGMSAKDMEKAGISPINDPFAMTEAAIKQKKSLNMNDLIKNVSTN